jgi:hypothetical protein
VRLPWHIAGAALALAVLAGAPAQAEPAPEPGLEYFERGVAQYRSGDYASALYLFQRARAEGNRNPNLSFDIALTLYQLRRDDEARRAFENLSFEPGYESFAEYHLGLLAVRAGDRELAAASLRRTATGAQHAPLRQLAGATLAELDGLLPRSRLAAYASLGAGYDTNAGYQPDELQEVAGTEASFVEGVGAIDRPLGRGQYLLGSVFAREYTDAAGEEFSQQTGQVALRGETGGRAWRASLTGRVEAAWLGGESLHQATTLAAEGRRVAGPGALIGRLAATYYDAGEVFAELHGWRQRAGLEFVLGNMAYGYELERNERADLQDEPEFASRSPVRHQVSLRSQRPLSARLGLEWGVRYRYSHYRDDDRFVADGALQQERRKDTLAEAQLGTRWRLARHWSLLAEGRYAANRSTIPGYEYDRASGLFSVEMSL